jgi:hypothetical protein
MTASLVSSTSCLVSTNQLDRIGARGDGTLLAVLESGPTGLVLEHQEGPRRRCECARPSSPKGLDERPSQICRWRWPGGMSTDERSQLRPDLDIAPQPRRPDPNRDEVIPPIRLRSPFRLPHEPRNQLHQRWREK